VIFYVDPSRLAIAKKLLEEKGMVIASAELVFKPINEMEISGEVKPKIISLIEKLEDLGDVQNTFINTSVY
jgi:transcriptional/translational regulatory protein YebC/TACO1